MKALVDYKLVAANVKDKKRLITYKLKSILDYAKDLEKEEITKINNYVEKEIPKQIKDYQMIMSDNRIIGCLLIEKYADGILLNEIYIEKNYRKKGLGTDIIQRILKEHSKVYLWVYKENSIAIKLYQKLGLKIQEETETRYFMKYEKN